MAIKVIRICDLCNTYHEQGIAKFEENIDSVEYPTKFTCSDCVLKIEHLAIMQAKENDGNGISCISTLINCMRKGEFNKARIVYLNEGDKIRAYPKVQQWLYDNLGCRIHREIDCQGWICKPLKKINDEIVKLIPVE